MEEIKKWNDIKGNYNQGTLILGNGASMAVHSRFGYSDLYEEAKDKGYLGDAQAVFDKFDTRDFELVLRHLWHSLLVIDALSLTGPGIDEIKRAYADVRSALIKTVQNTHIDYSSASVYLPLISNYLKTFKTVFSLNYDLLVYWAIQHYNRSQPYSFKDCFERSGIFGVDWERKRRPYGGARSTTLVFYPHGNLSLSLSDVERKVAVTDQNGLLDQIFDEWERGGIPVFVCEGTTENKIKSIQASSYMSQVFYEPLSEKTTSLVIYGWAAGEQDKHIVDRINKAKPARIAVSVYGEDLDLMDAVKSRFRPLTNEGTTLEFFDAQSSGAWNNP